MRSLTVAARPGTGCSAKPAASVRCVPIPGSHGSAFNQAGISTDLVTIAGQCGHEARHVAHVGRAGWKDWNVTRYARDNDLILVTDNASDFRQLYAAEPLHAGLVILTGLPRSALAGS
jgi:hypothetical protein